MLILSQNVPSFLCVVNPVFPIFELVWGDNIVKLQFQVQTSVLGLGVDFVLPLSQQQEQEQQEEPSPKSMRRKCTTDLKFGT